VLCMHKSLKSFLWKVVCFSTSGGGEEEGLCLQVSIGIGAPGLFPGSQRRLQSPDPFLLTPFPTNVFFLASTLTEMQDINLQTELLWCMVVLYICRRRNSDLFAG